MKLIALIALLALPLLTGCMNLQPILDKQAENCTSHFSGSLGGGMLGTQTGVVSFDINCTPTGQPITVTTTTTMAQPKVQQ